MPDEWVNKCIFSSRATSDSCTNPKSGNPYVFGHMNGVYWKFELKGRWRLKHINVTEGMGPIGNIMCFGPTTATASEQLVTGVDNTSALSMVRGTAKADDLVFQGECLRETEEYSAAEANTWLEHEGGYGNIITDLGSRDMWPELLSICGAYGITL